MYSKKGVLLYETKMEKRTEANQKAKKVTRLKNLNKINGSFAVCNYLVCFPRIIIISFTI